jgi:hypothetical protein
MLDKIRNLYGDLEINALLSGLPVSDFEFLTGVLAPAFPDIVGDSERRKDKVELSIVKKQFQDYAKITKNKTLKEDKMAFGRYIKFFEHKGYIEKFLDENDKRKK